MRHKHTQIEIAAEKGDNKQTNKQIKQNTLHKCSSPNWKFEETSHTKSPETNGIAKPRATRTTAYCAKLFVSRHRVCVCARRWRDPVRAASKYCDTYLRRREAQQFCLFLFILGSFVLFSFPLGLFRGATLRCRLPHVSTGLGDFPCPLLHHTPSLLL
jgi:hypothetical protein